MTFFETLYLYFWKHGFDGDCYAISLSYFSFDELRNNCFMSREKYNLCPHGCIHRWPRVRVLGGTGTPSTKRSLKFACY